MLISITENACRVCLAEQEIMINLFDKVDEFQEKRLYELLESCSNITIDRSDKQRQLICGDCTGELLVVTKFRAKCEQTLEILSQVQHIMVDDDKIPVPEDGQHDVNDDGDNFKNDVNDDDDDFKFKIGNASVITEDIDNIIIEEHVFEDNASIAESLIKDEIDTDQVINSPRSQSRLEEDLIFQDVSYVDEEETYTENLIVFDPDPETDSLRATEKVKIKTTVTPKPLIINYKCDVCGAGFAQMNNLTRHLQTHSPAEILECSTCHHPFTSSRRLEIHNETNPKCGETAEKSAKSEGVTPFWEEVGAVTESSTTNDDTRKSKVCNLCNRGFVSKSALETHFRVHTGDRPFKCNLCVKSFKSQGGLVLHLRRHSGVRPYSCSVCSKSFSESSNLRVHMRTHTGEKPHKCTICKRSFARVFLLQLHLRTHTGERPYQCPYCSKAFAQAGDLTSHKRTHTGERPHVCPVCKKGFIKSGGLTQHMRKHANNNAKYDSVMVCEDLSQVIEEDDQESKNDWQIIHEDDVTEHEEETDLNAMEFKVDEYDIEFSQENET